MCVGRGGRGYCGSRFMGAVDGFAVGSGRETMLDEEFSAGRQVQTFVQGVWDLTKQDSLWDREALED